MESNQELIRIEKIKGLNKIKINEQGSLLAPNLFGAKSKTDEQGRLIGPYKGVTFFHAKEFLAPHWDDVKNQWFWGGTHQELVRLIKEMELKYERGPKEGQIIEPNEENPERHLKDFNDPVFRHISLYGQSYMDEGIVNLRQNDAIQRFLTLCYKANTHVDDSDNDSQISPYIRAGQRYKMISPKTQAERDKREVFDEVDAVVLFDKIKTNETKLRAIAEIMEISGYGDSTEFDGLVRLFYQYAVKGDKPIHKYGGASPRGRFMALAKMKDSDLNITHQVYKGKRRGFLRLGKGFTMFRDKKIDGVTTELQLVNYFLDPKNDEDYRDLLDLLEGEKKKTA